MTNPASDRCIVAASENQQNEFRMTVTKFRRQYDNLLDVLMRLTFVDARNVKHPKPVGKAPFKKLASKDDVRKFFAWLTKNGCNFHPDDSLSDMIYRLSGKRVFSKTEAKRLDRLMAQAHELLGDGVYDECVKALRAAK